MFGSQQFDLFFSIDVIFYRFLLTKSAETWLIVKHEHGKIDFTFCNRSLW